MSTAYIKRRAEQTLRRCGTRDPFEIARLLGAQVFLRSDFKRLKGMYMVFRRNRFIFINSNLSEGLRRIVCAHELGHDALHRELASSSALREFMLYDMKSRPEYEANVFAADILLDDKEVLELARGGLDVEQIAAALQTDINLALIKLEGLGRSESLRVPRHTDSAFLGK